MTAEDGRRDWVDEANRAVNLEIEEAFRARARSKYADDSFPEHPCERCGRLYRGPAVYCSLECALEDA